MVKEDFNLIKHVKITHFYVHLGLFGEQYLALHTHTRARARTETSSIQTPGAYALISTHDTFKHSLVGQVMLVGRVCVCVLTALGDTQASLWRGRPPPPTSPCTHPPLWAMRSH